MATKQANLNTAEFAASSVGAGDTPSLGVTDGRLRQAHGAAAEVLAAKFLVQQGLKVIQRNFRVRGGEIDLICRNGDTVIFVEVRLRSNRQFGGAAGSITAQKQRRLIIAARHWLLVNGDAPCRFDCVLLDQLDGASIEWLRGAFSAD
ncbi:MAG: YraN family protein [Rhodocyclaceae bacterium]|nr:YraN family protein [Rhodocyclaceae bacterium]